MNLLLFKSSIATGPKNPVSTGPPSFKPATLPKPNIPKPIVPSGQEPHTTSFAGPGSEVSSGPKGFASNPYAPNEGFGGPKPNEVHSSFSKPVLEGGTLRPGGFPAPGKPSHIPGVNSGMGGFGMKNGGTTPSGSGTVNTEYSQPQPQENYQHIYDTVASQLELLDQIDVRKQNYLVLK